MISQRVFTVWGKAVDHFTCSQSKSDFNRCRLEHWLCVQSKYEVRKRVLNAPSGVLRNTHTQINVLFSKIKYLSGSVVGKGKSPKHSAVCTSKLTWKQAGQEDGS